LEETIDTMGLLGKWGEVVRSPSPRSDPGKSGILLTGATVKDDS